MMTKRSPVRSQTYYLSNDFTQQWFEADWLHCKRDALSSNRKVDGSRLTCSIQACHS